MFSTLNLYLECTINNSNDTINSFETISSVFIFSIYQYDIIKKSYYIDNYKCLHTSYLKYKLFRFKIKAGTKSRNENEHYKLGRFTLDAKHATLYNDETEEKKMLTVREAKILQLFCKNINETVERKAILSRFWDTEDDYFKSRSLDVFITKLRKLLKDEPRIELKNIRGVGYTLLLT
jgi:hypothetical protein